ncbi:MAG: serine hydrolase [Ferruginibacter sp.]
MRNFTAIFITFMAICPNRLIASEFAYERNIASAAHYDLTAEEFDQKCANYPSADYIMTDIDIYETAGGLRYSMVWKENTDKRVWMHYTIIYEHEFENLVKFLKNLNFRLTDWEAYIVNGSTRYAAIFVKNTENYEWEYRFHQEKTSFQNYARYKFYRGYNLTDLEISSTNNGLRFASVWVKYPVSIPTRFYFDMAYEEGQPRLQRLIDQGWYIVNYEPYKDGSSVKYAIILHQKNNYSGINHLNLTELQFANGIRMYKDMGYRLADFECVKTADGQRYAGTWVECDNRFNFSNKDTIDQLIKQYRYDNDLPGISVAIIRNGEMLYSRGFGFADAEAGKIAHGETIYLAASVSKVIGATLAVKLQDERRLRDGRFVSLNLNSSTRSYLTNVRKSDNSLVTLPAAHTHTLAQLYAHLGCLKHYDGGATPSIRQYDKAIDALTQIWDPGEAILDDCTVNASPSHYSTHAHTYLAAVLEQVTGRSSGGLIRSELAVPYGLKTMRAQFASSNMFPDYDRAKPYIVATTPSLETESGWPFVKYNKASSYENSSWKVFGGGIEISAVDLARFGWKVLNAEIVSRNARDNVLWRRVNTSVDCDSCDYGIGWHISNPGPSLIAQHGGTWSGAHSLIRIYKGDDLVIAIMSNRKDHKVRDIGVLASDIKKLL